jgi:type IV secretory pathway VirB10-like protein
MLIRLPFALRASDDPGTPPTPAAPPAPAAPPEPPAPPTAATIVVAAQPSERELSLAAELDAERGRLAATEEAKKQVEFAAAQLEDENFRLRKLQSAPERRKKSAWVPILNFED